MGLKPLLAEPKKVTRKQPCKLYVRLRTPYDLGYTRKEQPDFWRNKTLKYAMIP